MYIELTRERDGVRFGNQFGSWQFEGEPILISFEESNSEPNEHCIR